MGMIDSFGLTIGEERAYAESSKRMDYTRKGTRNKVKRFRERTDRWVNWDQENDQWEQIENMIAEIETEERSNAQDFRLERARQRHMECKRIDVRAMLEDEGEDCACMMSIPHAKDQVQRVTNPLRPSGRSKLSVAAAEIDREIINNHKEEIEKLFWHRRPVSQLASEFGVSYNVLCRWIEAHGFKRKPKDGAK